MFVCALTSFTTYKLNQADLLTSDNSPNSDKIGQKVIESERKRKRERDRERQRQTERQRETKRQKERENKTKNRKFMESDYTVRLHQNIRSKHIYKSTACLPGLFFQSERQL